MFRKRLKRSEGFTLSETLIAVMIMTLVGLIITGGIYTFRNSFVKVKNTANAQILVSNTELVLRDRLKYASQVKLSADGKTVQKVQDESSGMWYGFKQTTDGIYVTISGDVNDDETVQTGTEQESSDYVMEQALVNDASAVKTLRTAYDAITYEDGVFTVKGLKVVLRKDASNTLVVLDDMKIRNINVN